ncbi:hypothetical protein [Achromobacter dolens]|uniref:hypothetical protein n=1 Tax=Achromobacter dolens TaxID=1287738 RepID=UPI00300D9108
MRAHVIENGTVINSIEVEDLSFQVGVGRILVGSEAAGIGWKFENGSFVHPENSSQGEEPDFQPSTP